MFKVLNKKLKKNNKGFTLVELLVVIAIIGILAAFAVPSLLKNVEKSKVGAVETDFGTIKTAVMAYYADTGEYPTNITDLDDTTSSVTGYSGPYIDSIPGKTPFGGKYTLSTDGKKLILSDTGFKMSAASLKKVAQDLGTGVTANDGAADITNAKIPTNTKDATTVTIEITK